MPTMGDAYRNWLRKLGPRLLFAIIFAIVVMVYLYMTE